MTPFGDRLSADDLRAMALMLGASDPEIQRVLSRDRLMTIVFEYTSRALGQPSLTPEAVDGAVQQAFDRVWPGTGSLEARARGHIEEGVTLLFNLATLLASSDGVISRLERRFLTESLRLIGIQESLPRKAVHDPRAHVEALEPVLRRLAADPEAMRATLSFIAAVAVVDEVLRRPEIDLYYRLAELMGEDRKEAAILLEEVRRGYGTGLQSMDPVAAGRLSMSTAAALAAAEAAGFRPFLASQPGLRWLGAVWFGEGRAQTWPTWAAMLGALGAAVALSEHRGTVRFDRILPLAMYRERVAGLEPPAPALSEYTTPPW
ncbi:MAG TPA: hypothetical protein VGO93_10505 [Candidatus Xenobia bacterium]